MTGFQPSSVILHLHNTPGVRYNSQAIAVNMEGGSCLTVTSMLSSMGYTLTGCSATEFITTQTYNIRVHKDTDYSHQRFITVLSNLVGCLVYSLKLSFGL